jgi:hypothetical protein
MIKYILNIAIILLSVSCGATSVPKSKRIVSSSQVSYDDLLPAEASYGIVAAIDDEIRDVKAPPEINLPPGMKFYGHTKEEILEVCQNGVKKTQTQKILVPKTTACEYNKGVNLGKKEGHFQAMLKQKAEIELPAASAVCEVSLRTEDNSIKYNDHFAVTFQDVLLFSSFNMVDKFINYKGLYLFDWNRIKGQEVEDYSSYCIGVCRYPVADRVGSLRADFKVSESPEVAFALVTSAFMQSQLGKPIKGDIGIHVTGDKDDNDCSHNDVVVTVDVSYVELEK